MEMAQIRLSSQMARIQINQTQVQQLIEQRSAMQSIEQPKAELTMNTTPAKLTIDQTQAWEDVGIKSAFKIAEEGAQLGKQAVQEGTARIVRQGIELMMIEKKGNPIPSQAVVNRFGPPKQFNIGWIPSAGAVKINYKPANVDINVTPRKPVIDADIQKTMIDYKTGSTEISLQQSNNLEIDFANLKYYGINFEILI